MIIGSSRRVCMYREFFHRAIGFLAKFFVGQFKESQESTARECFYVDSLPPFSPFDNNCQDFSCQFFMWHTTHKFWFCAILYIL